MPLLTQPQAASNPWLDEALGEACARIWVNHEQARKNLDALRDNWLEAMDALRSISDARITAWTPPPILRRALRYTRHLLAGGEGSADVL